MDFKDSIKQISERIEKLCDNLQTEEATKNALIMPFLTALGYDVFNPLEVVPEMTCDIGTKKGEKIDYAIMKDGEPIILIECKHWKEDLNLHDNQLLRYFNVSKAKFGVLTNGVVYRFYTDLEDKNKMDAKPFLEVDLRQPKDIQVEELKKFHKSYFNVESILSTASELKYMGELKAIISQEFSNPSEDFVKLFGRQVYSGQFNKRVVEQFTALTKRAISSYISDQISDRLNAAMMKAEEQEETKPTSEVIDEEPAVVTTALEMEGFYVVKSILRDLVSADRITFKDTRDYFRVTIDGKVTKGVCLLRFTNEDNLRVGFYDENFKEVRYKLSSVDDLYQFADKIREAASKYI